MFGAENGVRIAAGQRQVTPAQGAQVKIAILLPTHFDVGTLLRARELTRILADSYKLEGSAVEIAVGLPERPEQLWRVHEDFLRRDAPCPVVVRRLRWEGFPAENVRRMFMLQQLQVDLRGFDTVQIPRDWGWNFVDCDLWFNLADPGQGAVLPLKPTATYVSDLAVRVIPEAYASGLSDPYWDRQLDAFRMWRRTGIVLCSDAVTASDLVGYAGVRRESVLTVGSLSNCDAGPSAAGAKREGKQWVWLVEPNERHANMAALEGLALYLQEGGSIQPIIATQEPLAFQMPETVKSMAGIDRRGKDLLEQLQLYHYRDYSRLSRLLRRCGGLWSSEVAGGEGLALTLAKRHGLRFMGQDFPLHRQLAAGWAGHAVLYAGADPVATADGLHQAEQAMDRAALPQPLDRTPNPLTLQQFGFAIDRLQEFANA